MKHRFFIAAVLTLPVFVLEIGAHLIPGMHHLIDTTIGLGTLWGLQMVLTTAVLFGRGGTFFPKVPRPLREWRRT